MKNNNGVFYLPDLPYAPNALEPYINEETIMVHHFTLHKKYVDQLNAIMEKNPGYQEYGLVELIQNVEKLPADIRTGVFRNAGGVLNHDYYFDMMRPAPNDLPAGKLGEAINKQFGSFDNFKKDFTTAAMAVFGSGWTWLVADAAGKLYIMNTENQVTPYSFDRIPIIPIDIWEHSFFQQYPAKRADYIEAWYNVADWAKADVLYSAL
ncbi:MAG: superoxide dismutase [Clostridiales bacterium]|nr:superoxide dismutase [Clostridiales bacterium]